MLYGCQQMSTEKLLCKVSHLALLMYLQAGKNLSLKNIQHFIPPHWAGNWDFSFKKRTQNQNKTKHHTHEKPTTTHTNHCLWQVKLFSHWIQPTTSHLLSPSWPFAKPAYSSRSDLSLSHAPTILQSSWPSGCSLRPLLSQNLQPVPFLPCSKESLK